MTHFPVELAYFSNYCACNLLFPQDISVDKPFLQTMHQTNQITMCSILPMTASSTCQKQPYPNKLPVNVSLWIPHLLLVFSAIQSPKCLTWQTYRYPSPKYFFFPDLGLYFTTVNTTLTHGQTPQRLMSLCWNKEMDRRGQRVIGTNK